MALASLTTRGDVLQVLATCPVMVDHHWRQRRDLVRLAGAQRLQLLIQRPGCAPPVAGRGAACPARGSGDPERHHPPPSSPPAMTIPPPKRPPLTAAQALRKIAAEEMERRRQEKAAGNAAANHQSKETDVSP